MFRDLKEDINIADHLLRNLELTYHPFETILDIVKVMQERGSTVEDGLRGIFINQLYTVIANAKGKVGVVAEGYQRNKAGNALDQIEAIHL